jgi:SAM-dependent methyltransferase
MRLARSIGGENPAARMAWRAKIPNPIRSLRQTGWAETLLRAARATFPQDELRRLGVLDLVGGKTGLEVGGPSAMFGRSGLAAVYLAAARIDNCNFADDTTWEGRIKTGRTFRFNPRREPGEQYVAEATDLGFAADGAYDFVLSSHALEHLANPLKALIEWRRVTRPGGALVMVLPHYAGTFDHRRPVTTLAHLIDDHERNRGEDDDTHVEEVLALHDLSRDPGGQSLEAFRAQTLAWARNRCLHHHVFDTHLAAEMTARAGYRVLRAERPSASDILVVATT